MKNRLFGCLAFWLGLATTLNAQLRPGQTIQAFARPVPNENAIQIKWLLGVPRTIQFQILRRMVGEKSFKQVSTKPLQEIKPGDAKGNGPVADARRRLMAFEQNKPKTKQDKRLWGQLFAMNTYTDNLFAEAAGMYFKDNTVVAGQTYEYVVSTVVKGKAYVWAMSRPVKAGAYRPEPAPIGFKAVQEAPHRIALSWVIRTDVLAYHVYRRRGAEAEEQLNKRPVVIASAVDGKQPAAQFTDTDSTLREGETYTYRIAALDPFVNAGEMSQPATVIVKDMTPPLGGSQLAGRVLTKKIRLRWLVSPTADCAGYQLFRGTAINKPFKPILPKLLAAADTAYTDETATEGATYYYYLRTEDRAGNGVNGSPIQVVHPDMTPPAPPTSLTASTDTTGHVTLRWRGNQEPDWAGYFVYRALADHPDNYAQLQLKPLKGTTFRDTLLRNNRNVFYYRVTAVDKGGNESKPTLIPVRLPDRRAPQAPRLAKAIATADSVGLTWTATDSDIQTFQVLRRRETDPKPAFHAIGRTTQRTYTDRLVPDGLYSYAIQAIDSTGNTSKPSADIGVVIDAKQQLAVATNVTVRYDEREKKRVVSWNAPVQPADFMGYRVLARLKGEPFEAVSPLRLQTQVTLGELDASQLYEIAVISISQKGQQLKSSIVESPPHPYQKP